MKGLTAALLIFVATMASAASVRIQSAFPSDSNGTASPVKLGESFYLTAKLQIDSSLNGSYRVRFDLPYASRKTSELTFAGEATVVWGPFTALLDRPFPVSVSLETSTDEAGTPLTIQVLPVLPNAGIEFFAPQSLSGSISAVATLTQGNTSGLQWYAPLPSTGGFQKVLTTIKQGAVLTSTPFAQPVLSTAKTPSTSVQFEAIASAVRANPSILRLASFDSYKVLASNVSVWLRAETLVESKSGEITSFVSRTLPKNFKQTMKPYDAAQKLFQAVVARVQYAAATAKPDALVALRTGRGDCGYFSALFVACCRNAGIPARTVCGLTMGDNEWHVWAEFWIPNSGWVPVDPSYCDTLCPDGSLPLYFGTIPQLNERVALTYGFDHVMGRSLPMLQSPAVVASGSSRLGSVQPFCSLSLASGN